MTEFLQQSTIDDLLRRYGELRCEFEGSNDYFEKKAIENSMNCINIILGFPKISITYNLLDIITTKGA